MAEATEKNEYEVARERLSGLLKAYNPPDVIKHERDMLAGRYRIMLNQPVPEFTSPFATAYAAADMVEKQAVVYALVYENGAVIRHRNIAVLKELRHPNLVSVLEDGIVDISTLSESRYVAILEKPVGKPLSLLLAEGRNPVSETILITYFLRPLVDIVRQFARMGISHNRINLGSIYLSRDSIMLGECISEPSGFSQDFRFEPIERAMTSPLAKSDYAIGADCYALAVLALHLSLGFMPFAKMDRDSFIESMLNKGSYHTLAIEWDFSDNLQDFFRGLLNDTRRERWDPDSMENWIGGRHFNLISPSLPRETGRAFDIMGISHFNRKSLAYTLFRRWEEGRSVLFDTKVGRWIETSLHKPELAESVLRIAGSRRSEHIRYENQNNELLARTLILLDPAAPLRLKNLAAAIDGIGPLLTSAFLKGNQEDTNTIIQMIESELFLLWLEQQAGPTDYTMTTWKLQKVRGNLKIRSLGFGMERGIYDLHPELPCQSPIVKPYHVTSIRDLLLLLDVIARQAGLNDARNDSFMDRHIAGFIASKLDIGKAIRITELEVLPKIASHPDLIGLKLLIRAQHKMDNPLLKGLCYWAAIKLMPLISNIHKKSMRDRFQKDLATAASTGLLKAIGDLFFNPDVFVADYHGFQNAIALYKLRKTQMGELRNNNILTRHSQIAGRGIAQTVAYGICLTVVYYTLKAYFRF